MADGVAVTYIMKIDVNIDAAREWSKISAALRWLDEMQKCCCREAREGRAELEDESYDEVIELLRFICPGPEYLLRRDVTGKDLLYP